MNYPLDYSGGLLILFIGFLFGYFLENSGLGSPRKLNAQFGFQDWTVFKVMFIAILVAAIGIWSFTTFGWLSLNALKIATPYYYAMALGGMLLGMGLTIGGYCPGTSVVGLFSGRLDGLMFMIGLLIGTVLFSLTFAWIKPLFLAAKGPKSQTLAQLLTLPVWGILTILISLAIIGFWLASHFEALGEGIISADELTTNKDI